MADDLPQKFGNYTLHKLIARGGMAEIYRATMSGIGGFEKTVAIKKILPHLAENDEFITMLKDEANILVSISHANIAQVYDLGKIEDTYFISMEYVHGIDLAHVIKSLQKRGEYLPTEHAVYVASLMCGGLHAAHTNTDKQGNPLNIVHRDVSPHNVIISFAGDVKLIDFGVAKAAVKESHTQMGVIKGKLLYMAPEQAMAKDLDGRADLFAVGLCMYKMLTCELPFSGDNEFQIYNNILSKEIVPPRQLNPAVPEEVNQIVMTLLQRDPDKRYQDGYAAKQELERALHNIAPGYTVNRLSRFIEGNFSDAAQEQQQNAQDISGPSGVAPQTPSANAVGTGQLASGDQIPDLELEPVQFDGPGGQKQRVHAGSQGGPETAPAAASAGPAGSLRTETNRDSTGNFNTDRLAQEADGRDRTGPPAALYAIGALLLVIGGLVAYQVAAGTSSPDADRPAESAGASAASSPTVQVSLSSSPAGAQLLRGADALGSTPHELTLMRSDEPITLTLRKDGFEDLSFQLIPDSDLEQDMELEPLEEQDEEAAAELNFEAEEDEEEGRGEPEGKESAPAAEKTANSAEALDDAPSGGTGRPSTPTSAGGSTDDKADEPPKPEPDTRPEPGSRAGADDQVHADDQAHADGQANPDDHAEQEPSDKPAPSDDSSSLFGEAADDKSDDDKPADDSDSPGEQPQDAPSEQPAPSDELPSLFDEPADDEPAESPEPTSDGDGQGDDEEPDDILDPFG